MKKILFPALLLFSFVLPVFAQDTTPITQEQAVEIAKQEAIANGRSPDWFGGSIDASFDGKEWFVHFDGKPDPVYGRIGFGNHFGAFVSSDGKEVRIHGGR